MKNKKTIQSKRKIEFSKWIILGVMLTYFIGLIFGVYIIAMLLRIDTTYVYAALGSLFAYIAAPVSVAIGFYNYKAKAENVAKINNPIQENIPTTVINNASNVGDVSYDNLNEQLKKAEEFRLDDNDESLKG